MIVLNNKLAKEALANAIKCGRVKQNSNPHAYLLQALIHLNIAFDARKDPSLFVAEDSSLDDWSSAEVTVAETINWLIAFLEHHGCASIEQLLKDVSRYRKRHPDYPKGAWPFKQA